MSVESVRFIGCTKMEQLISKSSPYFYPLSLGFTALVLIFSVVFTYKKLQNNRHPEPRSERPAKTQQQQMMDCDSTNNEDNTGGGDGPVYPPNLQPEVDPMTYCEHIQSEVKKAKQRVTAKKFNKELTEEQIEEEREVQRKQLQSIFEMMKTDSERFGISSLDDVQSQMKLYA